ncbi:MAG: hypothetical protein JO032_01045 [Alphaproteobacteria bacterium]|nr:hypothetical protein [Alphaproteobacteria bacterium]
MWNLTPEYLQQVKEELKGRRAAIQARYADELKALEADLEEIETLERVAYAVAAKHVPEPAPAGAHAEPVAVAELEPAEAAAEDGPGAGSKGLSRWRMRLDAKNETETA